MNKIVPHLWFDHQAKEAVDFYVSAFPDSKVLGSALLTKTPSGDCDVLSFQLAGQPFMAISAGPYFVPNPSISFMVNFDPSRDEKAEEHLNTLWEKLSDGAKVLMPLDAYPFSKRYGWIQDKYGFSWQLILTDPDGEERPNIIPSLLFVGDVYGRAEEAVDFYTSVFKQSKKGQIARYGAEHPPEKEEGVMFADFSLYDTWFAAMDSAQNHKFIFNEAVSLMVMCDDQAEVDYYWQKLSAVPEAEQCGWVKDQFGVSWQIVPRSMNDMMIRGTQEQVDRMTEVMLKMKKLDVGMLEEAFEGGSRG